MIDHVHELFNDSKISLKEASLTTKSAQNTASNIIKNLDLTKEQIGLNTKKTGKIRYLVIFDYFFRFFGKIEGSFGRRCEKNRYCFFFNSSFFGYNQYTALRRFQQFRTY